MFIGSAAETGKLLFAGEEAATRWAGLWQASDEMKELYDKNRAAAAKYTWQPRLYDPKLARWLHRIDVPTHIVWGEGDFLIPPAHGEELQRLIPGATLTRIAGVGHLGDIEAPSAFAEAIDSFHRGAGRHESPVLPSRCPMPISISTISRNTAPTGSILPNTYFDPQKGHALYNRYLDELELAAELGFDGVSVNEHHQNAYGLMPSPVVTASALARRVKTAKIAILGNAFGLRDNPLTLGRRACDDRRHHRRPADLRHGARHRRRILLDGRQPGLQP